MKYDIKAKATKYRGCNFRSRLEARWACFFDYMEWDWEYEPSEINGYNPDFIIRCSTVMYPCNHILVEVKPSIMVADGKFKNEMVQKYKKVPCHILLLTDFPFRQSSSCPSYVEIGEGSQYYEQGFTHDFMYSLDMKPEKDIGSSYQSYDGMIRGDVHRKLFIEYGSYEHHALLNTWKEAGNKTQFIYG